MKQYTVVGFYLEDARDTFVDLFTAASSQAAAAMSRKDRLDQVFIVAVFEGHHTDILHDPPEEPVEAVSRG